VARLTRRQLLRQAGGSTLAAASVAVGATPAGAAAGQGPGAAPAPAGSSADVTGRLARYMVAARDRELPLQVVLDAKARILDTVAAIVSGSRLPPGQAAIRYVRSMGGTEWDLYRKVLVPGVLPYIVAGARIAVGRGLIGILVGEFFAASEGIGYAIARFGDLFALDKMFACILAIMVIAVVLTEGIRWAERAAFPWRVGQ